MNKSPSKISSLLWSCLLAATNLCNLYVAISDFAHNTNNEFKSLIIDPSFSSLTTCNSRHQQFTLSIHENRSGYQPCQYTSIVIPDIDFFVQNLAPHERIMFVPLMLNPKIEKDDIDHFGHLILQVALDLRDGHVSPHKANDASLKGSILREWRRYPENKLLMHIFILHVFSVHHLIHPKLVDGVPSPPYNAFAWMTRKEQVVWLLELYLLIDSNQSFDNQFSLYLTRSLSSSYADSIPFKNLFLHTLDWFVQDHQSFWQSSEISPERLLSLAKLLPMPQYRTWPILQHFISQLDLFTDGNRENSLNAKLLTPIIAKFYDDEQSIIPNVMKCPITRLVFEDRIFIINTLFRFGRPSVGDWKSLDSLVTALPIVDANCKIDAALPTSPSQEPSEVFHVLQQVISGKEPAFNHPTIELIAKFWNHSNINPNAGLRQLNPTTIKFHSVQSLLKFHLLSFQTSDPTIYAPLLASGAAQFREEIKQEHIYLKLLAYQNVRQSKQSYLETVLANLIITLWEPEYNLAFKGVLALFFSNGMKLKQQSVIQNHIEFIEELVEASKDDNHFKDGGLIFLLCNYTEDLQPLLIQYGIPHMHKQHIKLLLERMQSNSTVESFFAHLLFTNQPVRQVLQFLIKFTVATKFEYISFYILYITSNGIKPQTNQVAPLTTSASMQGLQSSEIAELIDALPNKFNQYLILLASWIVDFKQILMRDALRKLEDWLHQIKDIEKQFVDECICSHLLLNTKACQEMDQQRYWSTMPCPIDVVFKFRMHIYLLDIGFFNYGTLYDLLAAYSYTVFNY